LILMLTSREGYTTAHRRITDCRDAMINLQGRKAREEE